MMMTARLLEQSWLRVRRLAERYPNQFGGEDLLGEDPLRVFTGTQRPRRVLVASSEAALKRWDRSEWPPGLVVVVTAGMVSKAQASIIGAMAAKSPHPIGFVGDASPMGLHTYLSLKSYLGASRVRYCGVCDAVLTMLGRDVPSPEFLTSRDHSAFDKAHLRIVVSLAKPEQVLGPRVAAVVRSGRTIPIAALSYRAGLVRVMFEAASRLSSQRER
jgi:hypothetical protein